MATQTTVASPKWTLQLRDWANGAIMAVIGAVGGTIFEVINVWATQPTFSFDKIDLIMIAKGAIVALVSYVVKRLTDPSKIILVNPTKEDMAAVKSGNEVTIPAK